MVRWCEANRKHPTRRRLVNWLNRCDRPLVAVGSGSSEAPQKPSAFTLKLKRDALNAMLRDLERCGFEDAMGLQFNNPADRREHRRLQREIGAVAGEMAKL